MTYKQEKIEASLQTINVLYESQDTFVNDNYNESSRHCPNMGHPSAEHWPTLRNVMIFTSHIFSKILIAEMLWRPESTGHALALLSINFSSVITRNSLKNVTYRPLCKGIETLLRYCGTWLTDLWSSLVSQTNYVLHICLRQNSISSHFATGYPHT